MSRQQPIPVTTEQRRILNEMKFKYEEATGDKGSWGHFLISIGNLAMISSKITPAIEIVKLHKYSVDVRCVCRENFSLSLQGIWLKTFTISCPFCESLSVVNLLEKSNAASKP